MVWKGEVVGAASCGSDVELTTTQSRGEWFSSTGEVDADEVQFPGSQGVGQDGGEAGHVRTHVHTDRQFRGDYEFKVLWNNHLARVIKVHRGGGWDVRQWHRGVE